MLQVGDMLPPFAGTNQDGTPVNSDDFRGKKLIIFFYPRANTPGCTAEACNLAENFSTLQNEGFSILGISADSVQRQKNFQSKYQFPYDLIADEEKDINKKFGVWKPKKFMGKEFLGTQRATFIFDENNRCTHVIDKVKTKEHTQQILDLLVK